MNNEEEELFMKEFNVLLFNEMRRDPKWACYSGKLGAKQIPVSEKLYPLPSDDKPDVFMPPLRKAHGGINGHAAMCNNSLYYYYDQQYESPQMYCRLCLDKDAPFPGLGDPFIAYGREMMYHWSDRVKIEYVYDARWNSLDATQKQRFVFGYLDELYLSSLEWPDRSRIVQERNNSSIQQGMQPQTTQYATFMQLLSQLKGQYEKPMFLPNPFGGKSMRRRQKNKTIRRRHNNI